MTTLAIIHAGYAAPKLKEFVAILNNKGVREKFFMEDLIDILRFDEDFDSDLLSLKTEIEYGEYYRYYLQDLANNAANKVPDFLNDVAVLTTEVATYLHNTLVAQGRYNHDGEFLYDFHSFDGRIIFLQERGIPRRGIYHAGPIYR